jgi:hypothetical protein
VGNDTGAIKAKTDQLDFTANGIVSDAGVTDNTARFDALDTVTAGIKAKTDQLTFGIDGVNADVAVSINNAIDYDARFDALDLATTGIKDKTDQLTFTPNGVVSDSGVEECDLTAISANLSAIDTIVQDIAEQTSKISFEEVLSEGDANLAGVTFKAEYDSGNINSDTGQTGTITTGTPTVTSVFYRTGTSALLLNNATISYGNFSGATFGTQDFTIEFSVMFSSVPSTSNYAGIIGKRNDNSQFDWIVFLFNGVINFLPSGTSAVSIAHPQTISVGIWYDVAISRTGSVLKMFINGVSHQVSCPGMDMTNSSAPLFVGRLSHGMAQHFMNGALDRIRITKGTGRYDTVTPVSPPTSTYPTTINGSPTSYKVIANCDTNAIPQDLEDRLDDLRNRVNAVHFVVQED